MSTESSTPAPDTVETGSTPEVETKRKPGRPKGSGGGKGSGKKRKGRGVGRETLEKLEFIYQETRKAKQAGTGKPKTNAMVKAVKDKFGTMIAQPKAKEAINTAWSGRGGMSSGDNGAGPGRKPGRKPGRPASTGAEFLIVITQSNDKKDLVTVKSEAELNAMVNRLLKEEDVPLSRVAVYTKRETEVSMEVR